MFASAGNRVDDAEPGTTGAAASGSATCARRPAPVATGSAAATAIAPAQPQPPKGFQLNSWSRRSSTRFSTRGKCRAARSRRSNVSSNVGNTIGRSVPSSITRCATQQESWRAELQQARQGQFPDHGNQHVQTGAAAGRPAAAGPWTAARSAKGDWVKQPEAIGEHWVSDGKSIYEYRPQDKQVVERPIPPQMQGQAIVDGPLPFLFGAEAAKLKQRYWMKILHLPAEQQNPNQIWLLALTEVPGAGGRLPRSAGDLQSSADAARGDAVTLPNGDRHAYMFESKARKRTA